MPAHDCVFCKIAAGQIPAAIVYKSEHAVVFKDLTPKAPVHLLAIPREHVAGVHELSPEQGPFIGRLFDAVKAVIGQEGLADRGYRLVINSGEQGGQTVPHLHVHILSGRDMTWPPG